MNEVFAITLTSVAHEVSISKVRARREFQTPTHTRRQAALGHLINITTTVGSVLQEGKRGTISHGLVVTGDSRARAAASAGLASRTLGAGASGGGAIGGALLISAREASDNTAVRITLDLPI